MSKAQTNAERVAAVQSQAVAAADKWLAEAEANGAIAKRVRDTLDGRLTEVVAKLLGFDNRWSEWEVDHCNGRSGESAAGDWLRERAKGAIAAWLDEQAGALPALPKSAVASLRAEYVANLQRVAGEQLRRMAQADAIALVGSIVADVTDGDQ